MNKVLPLLALPILVTIPAEAQSRRIEPVIKVQESGPFGDAIRAIGEAQLAKQQAEQEALETKKKNVETYWYIKRYREREMAKDVERQRTRRDNYLANKGSGAPERLSATELDRGSGTIDWPKTFDAPDYADHRRTIDSLFEERAKTGNRVGLKQEVVTACNGLEGVLRANIRTMPTDEYLEAKAFLRSLQDEHRDF